MKNIRSKRLTTFRKKHINLLITLKILLIYYLLVVGSLQLTSSTNAYFIDQTQYNGNLQAGTWPWDKSSLKFTGVFGGNCEEIFAEIMNGNGSRDMQGTSRYEVYYSQVGNPKDGKLIFDSGIINKLTSGEKQILTFTPTDTGNYKFKGYQRPGHNGQGVLWSKTITVTCEAKGKKEETSEVIPFNDSTSEELTPPIDSTFQDGTSTQTNEPPSKDGTSTQTSEPPSEDGATIQTSEPPSEDEATIQTSEPPSEDGTAENN